LIPKCPRCNGPVWKNGGGKGPKRFLCRSPHCWSGSQPVYDSDAVAHIPAFPDDDIDAPQILDQMERRFLQRQQHADALRWFEVEVREDAPLAINWFGDPHLGSNGCNVPLLRRDVAIVASTPGMVGANIGDTTDNWGGRLLRLYAENDVSKSTERRLARWFLEGAGIPWLLWLEGNHDMMDAAFTTYLRAVNGSRVPMVDWRARFVLAFPNGRKVRVDAAHNHKGHSQWNELHGQERASVFDEPAHLYIAGHHHVAALKQKEMPDGTVATLARARGYKWLDEHAEHHGFHQKQGGASIVTVIDPAATTPWGLVRAFADTAEGAEYLTWKRKKAA
jgi:hypothetical protein